MGFYCGNFSVELKYKLFFNNQINMNKKQEEQFDKEYSNSPKELVFKVHTGGFVNSDFDIDYGAREDVKAFINKNYIPKTEVREVLKEHLDTLQIVAKCAEMLTDEEWKVLAGRNSYIKNKLNI